MVNALMFALLAAVGNAIFVFGQRGGADQSENPFLFTLFSVGVCTVLFFLGGPLTYLKHQPIWIMSSVIIVIS